MPVKSLDLPRKILVCGATGQQGGAVVRALLANPPGFEHEILALTRNPTSKSAIKLSESSKVSLITGDLDHVDEIFSKAGGAGSVWGVFSVQVPEMTKTSGDQDRELQQGCDLIDAAIKYGVEYFVYTSVDRGGSESLNNPTNIPHFISKHKIEHHLIENTSGSDMTYTILRPVAFMEGMQPTLFGRIFAGMWAQVGDKKLHLVATKDIGIAAAQAFAFPGTDEHHNNAISLAGDALTQAEANEVFWSVLGRPQVKNELLGSFVKYMVPDVGLMFKWFEDVGYDVDIEKCRQLNPEMRDLATWLREESAFRR